VSEFPSIRITASGVDLTVQLGDGAPTPTAGIGGWDKVSRADRVSISDWTGVDPIELDIPVLLDGLAEDRSVQAELDILVSLGLTADRTEPPPFTVTGPIPFSGTEFVLMSLDWGDNERNSSGVLIRQALTLHLMEHIEPDSIAPKTQAAKAKGSKTRVYVVKGKKETLQSIAKSQLGDARRAKEIGKLNGIRDTLEKLQPGQKIRLPAK
jgi:LysM domain